LCAKIAPYLLWSHVSKVFQGTFFYHATIEQGKTTHHPWVNEHSNNSKYGSLTSIGHLTTGQQYFITKLVCKPILQAKCSNKQKTKVLCIKVHFVHFYPSNECYVKRHSFFFHNLCVYIVCVCVLFFSHTPKAKTQNLFFLLGVDGNIICKRDRWWVYWLLIVYTLLLYWQFSPLIYIFFRNVEIFYFLFFFPQVTKKKFKKILNIQENSIWLKWFFDLFIYLFDKYFLKLATKVFFF
jgi:hypothetical protein